MDPKEDDEDPEEDPADYPAGRDDSEEEEDEPSRDHANDEEDDDEDEDKEEEEHPAPTDSTSPPPVPRVTARMSIRPQAPALAFSEADAERFLAIPTLPPSPLTPLSSPLPPIPSLPLPVSPPVPMLPSPPASPIRPLGYRVAMIRQRAESSSTSYSLSPPASSSPLHLLSIDHRGDRPEVTLPPRKRLDIALGPRYEVRESSSAAVARPTGGPRADYGFIASMDREIRHDPDRDVGYGITDSWDEIVEALQRTPDSTDTELRRHMT
ncbi:hypothetical protein Tco_0068754, partial [Tanacetum coccineum]